MQLCSHSQTHTVLSQRHYPSVCILIIPSTLSHLRSLAVAKKNILSQDFSVSTQTAQAYFWSCLLKAFTNFKFFSESTLRSTNPGVPHWLAAKRLQTFIHFSPSFIQQVSIAHQQCPAESHNWNCILIILSPIWLCLPNQLYLPIIHLLSP